MHPNISSEQGNHDPIPADDAFGRRRGARKSVLRENQRG
jgi:hypothetical protein